MTLRSGRVLETDVAAEVIANCIAVNHLLEAPRP